MGDNTTHQEGVGRIPPQGGPQFDKDATSEREGRCVGMPPTGGRDVRVRTAGSGYLRLPPPEHGHIVYCNQAHYGSVSGGGAETGAKGVQAVVGI